MRYLFSLLILVTLSVPATAQGFDPTVYEWTHVRVSDRPMDDGSKSVLQFTLETLNADGWEIYGPPQRVQTSGTFTYPYTGAVSALIGGTETTLPHSGYDVLARRPRTGQPSVPFSAPAPVTLCTSPRPDVSWACVNGGWLPPGHPGNPIR